jgi:hypothetical protein
MSVGRKIAVLFLGFLGIGLGVSGLVAALASLAPSVFGWFTMPFWILPALAGLGAHDVDWPLFAVSGTISYGIIAFVVWYLWQHRVARR